VAFAIGRAIGSSVVRNRLRRRLRAVLTSPSAANSGTQLPAGWYLIGARPGIAELSFAQLTREVIGLVAAVERQRPVAAAGSSDS
jgi:ribonuclease P protein component